VSRQPISPSTLNPHGPKDVSLTATGEIAKLFRDNQPGLLAEAVQCLHIKPLTQCRNAGGEVQSSALALRWSNGLAVAGGNGPLLNFVIMANFSTKPMARETASNGSTVRPNVSAKKEQGYGFVRSFNAFAVSADPDTICRVVARVLIGAARHREVWSMIEC
jgi:hypothetical protein